MDMTFIQLKKVLEQAELQCQETEKRYQGEVVNLLLQLSEEKKNSERLEKELAALKRSNEFKKSVNMRAKLAEIQKRLDAKRSHESLNPNISYQRELPAIDSTIKLPEIEIKIENIPYEDIRFDFTQNFKF